MIEGIQRSISVDNFNVKNDRSKAFIFVDEGNKDLSLFQHDTINNLHRLMLKDIII